MTCHLGRARRWPPFAGGRSVDTTMGFTPLDGLVMATRSGSIDPGLVLWLEEHVRMPPAELAATLEHRSGLLGLAGTADMRAILERRGGRRRGRGPGGRRLPAPPARSIAAMVGGPRRPRRPRLHRRRRRERARRSARGRPRPRLPRRRRSTRGERRGPRGRRDRHRRRAPGAHARDRGPRGPRDRPRGAAAVRDTSSRRLAGRPMWVRPGPRGIVDTAPGFWLNGHLVVDRWWVVPRHGRCDVPGESDVDGSPALAVARVPARSPPNRPPATWSGSRAARSGWAPTRSTPRSDPSTT